MISTYPIRSLLCAVVLLNAVSCVHTSSPPQQLDTEPANLNSPFPSTIKGVGLNGAHVVIQDTDGPKVIRSQAPKTEEHYQELKDFGVTDVLIFKNEGRKAEINNEIFKWQSQGLTSTHIKNIPFPYKDFPDFKTPCQQTVEALTFIKNARHERNSRVLFHCTVGEDRTGYLAGLIRLMESKSDIESVFRNELCENGYSSGNPGKPEFVISQINEDLTPVFLQMAYLIKIEKLSWTNLNPKICNSNPKDDAAFKNDPQFNDPKIYKCIYRKKA